MTVDKIAPASGSRDYPRCVAGSEACPPEDVGGVWGYAHIFEALGDPEAENHDEYVEWYGEEFRPEPFSVDQANDRLYQGIYQARVKL